VRSSSSSSSRLSKLWRRMGHMITAQVANATDTCTMRQVTRLDYPWTQQSLHAVHVCTLHAGWYCSSGDCMPGTVQGSACHVIVCVKGGGILLAGDTQQSGQCMSCARLGRACRSLLALPCTYNHTASKPMMCLHTATCSTAGMSEQHTCN
jgi:hypothetical protein